jgi:hypothetical protein
MLKIIPKGRLMNTWEQYYVYKYGQENIKTKEQFIN